MVASDFRKSAREKLAGKWGKVACIMLIYIAFTILFGLVEEILINPLKSIASVCSYIILIPIRLGVIISYVKIFNGEDVGAFEFFELGFKNFGKAWAIAWFTFTKMILPTILVIVSIIFISAGLFLYTISAYATAEFLLTLAVIFTILGILLFLFSIIWLIMKSYYYTLAKVIAAEDEEISGKDAVVKSRVLMKNKRGKLFCLEFSFILWYLLVILTFGIGMIWLTPYMQFAGIAFYKNALKEKEPEELDDKQEPIA